ncbi:hypothetical protein B7494_g4102 [Chlorociboria aeruginascens]|nr:hypothetical protein B7494_g4102 [Chlorociboria aeruginascens]
MSKDGQIWLDEKPKKLEKKRACEEERRAQRAKWEEIGLHLVAFSQTLPHTGSGKVLANLFKVSFADATPNLHRYRVKLGHINGVEPIKREVRRALVGGMLKQTLPDAEHFATDYLSHIVFVGLLYIDAVDVDSSTSLKHTHTAPGNHLPIVRPGHGSLLLNVNIATSTFYPTDVTLHKFISNRWTHDQAQHADTELRNLKTGIVATCDNKAVNYLASARLQSNNSEDIEGLETMIYGRLHTYQLKRKKFPAHILFYCDGVSESQPGMVKDKESPARYADILCDRLRCYMKPALENKHFLAENRPVSAFSQNSDVWSIHNGMNPWHSNLNDSMFYL